MTMEATCAGNLLNGGWWMISISKIGTREGTTKYEIIKTLSRPTQRESLGQFDTMDQALATYTKECDKIKQENRDAQDPVAS